LYAVAAGLQNGRGPDNEKCVESAEKEPFLLLLLADTPAILPTMTLLYYDPTVI
jgi:hypothetical protein